LEKALRADIDNYGIELHLSIIIESHSDAHFGVVYRKEFTTTGKFYHTEASLAIELGGR
jgi:hypothetical protein